MRVKLILNKANAHLGDLGKVAGASVLATITPYIASVDGTVYWMSLVLKLGVPLLAFIYTGMKIYYLWKNKGE